MKPELKDGWVHCLAMFIPYGMPDIEWENMSVEDRPKQAEWRAYRFDPESVYQYNRGGYPHTVTIRYHNGDAMTVTGTIEQMDICMVKQKKVPKNE